MKIGALIPIRLASERLPGKALKDICGRPVVHHLLDRIAACRHIHDTADIVICTTEETTDDALLPVAENFGASVFRGSSIDILRRFGDAMEKFGFDAVVQADGDDPLSATEYMDLTMDRLLADQDADIVSVTGVPLGTATKSFSRTAMDKVLDAYRTVSNDTGFAYFFTKTGLCNSIEIKPISEQHIHDTARLTLDYEADLELFRTIFEALYKPGAVFGLDDVVSFLNQNPDTLTLNAHVDKEYWKRHSAKTVIEFEDSSGRIQRITT